MIESGIAGCARAKTDGPVRSERRGRSRAPRAEADSSKVLHVTALKDPLREMDKVHALYDSLMEARRGLGEDVVPFHRFAALVKDQVSKLRDSGTAEVAFRVAVKDGKVNFTVRGLKGGEDERPETGSASQGAPGPVRRTS